MLGCGVGGVQHVYFTPFNLDHIIDVCRKPAYEMSLDPSNWPGSYTGSYSTLGSHTTMAGYCISLGLRFQAFST